MGKIVLLDELTINQIAAGEVIERPASVVKEMVENSIDAGAKNITIEIKNGGISLIRITDDGSGIAADDMDIAFERHATSKIRQAKDLEIVQTMGFRGEALASISAIAKVEMISKTAEDEIGHKIVIEGGKVLEKDEVAAQKGTRITVQNLFYNTPVRYKFLKKDYTEAGYIETVVTRIALINRNVSIKLINNDKVLLQTNGSGDFKNIIYSIYGKDVSEGIIDVDYTYEDMRVSGVIGVPEIARSNRSNQMFFVNGRYIKDGKLSSASEQAYRDLLPFGKYAFLILNIEVDPKKVDVNVHPAKLEVRFEEDAEVFRAVYNAVRAGLGKEVLGSSINKTGFENQEVIKTEQNQSKENEKEIPKIEVVEKANENTIDVPKIEPLEKTEENKVEDLKIETSEKPKLKDFLKKFAKEPEEAQEQLKEKEAEKKSDVDFVPKYLAPENLDFEEESVNEKKSIGAFIPKHLEPEKIESKVEVPTKIESVVDENNASKIEETKEKEPTIANEDIAEKEIVLGKTKISSNTRELDFDITEALKEATQQIVSTKEIEIQETQVLPVTKVEVSQNTQVVDLNEIKTENKEEVEDKLEEIAPQETTEVNLEEVQAADEKKEKIEATVPSVEAVENITSRILELKMNNMDNTQIIDTSKVREAMTENEITPEFANMYKKTFGVDANIIRKEREIEEKEKEKINVSKEFVNAENDNLFENEEVIPTRVNYKLIGTAFNTNIIIELNNEMYIIDQNSALERLTYEAIKNNYYNTDVKDSQNLLLADIITVTYREMSIARENIELFENAGFKFEEFGENTLKLTAVPSICEELNTKQLFINVLNEIDRVALDEKEEKEEKFIVAVAKYATTKIKRALDEREIDDILQKLLTLENPFDTSHGTTTAVKMSRADIEKKFSRRK